MWNFLKNLFDCRSLEEIYLSGATDACELERRMKNLRLGRAPFQQQYRYDQFGR